MAPPTPRAIVSTVRIFARRHDLFRPGPLVLAVSGGADSTALALIASQLADEFGLVLHVAHFDHRSRPRESAADAQFVADLAARIGAPLRVGRAERAPKSEDDARRERYAFLRRVAAAAGATAIATAHTRDDQAETVLLHLTRGSGLAGAAGMRPLRDGIVRPLLAVGRAQTEAVCRAAGIVPREDASNRDVRFARNRIRHRVLPELEAINPQVRAALARFADAAAEVEALLGDTATPALTRVIDVTSLPRSRAERARALARAWSEATGRTLSAKQRDALVGLAATAHGTRSVDLPGGAAVREYERLRIAVGAAGRDAPDHDASADETPLRTGRLVEWHGWRIGLGMESDGLRYRGAVGPEAASRLAVRARRPGDRVGRRKVQDLFVNAKIPLRSRDTWPLVTLDGQVIWIPGVTPAPRGGALALAAGPSGEDARGNSGYQGRFTRARQVASKSEARPAGGKRGRT